MNLPNLAIRRPVATVVIIGLFVLIGAVSFGNVPLDLLPNINVPVAVVVTQYPGAGPQEIEQLVSIPIEEALGTVTNISSVDSQSMEGSSLVVAQFAWGTDIDSAVLEIRDKIDRVKAFLPDDANDPMVLKIDPTAMSALQVSVSGGRDMAELKSLVEDYVIPGLERLDGVAAVDVVGGRDRQVHINLDVDKLQANGLSILQVVQALRTENLNLPAGAINDAGKQYVVRVLGEYTSLDDIRNVSIATPFSGYVKVGDLGDVTEGLQDSTTIARLNGKPTLGLAIQKESGANTVQVVSESLQRLDELKAQLPGHLEVGIASNPAEFIQHSLQNVSQSAIIGGVLAVVILYLFLASFRTTAIIAMAIPISIIVTFSLLYFFHLTLNMMSLGGLALGIGMLVDNAVVVLESIYRHRRSGEDAITAASVGAQEVAMAITASTLTSIAVFLPIVFVEGLAAELFRQLALTVTFSLLASLFVALTLIPMLSARWLKSDGGDAGVVSARTVDNPKDSNQAADLTQRVFFFQRWYEKFEGLYKRIITWALGHRAHVLIGGIVFFALSLALIPYVGTEFLPTMDTGEFTVQIELPRGSSLEKTDQVTSEVENIVLQVPELETAFTTVGSSSFSSFRATTNEADRAVIFGRLVSRDQRQRTNAQILEAIRKDVAAVPGANVKVADASTLTSGGNMLGDAPIIVTISGDDLDTLNQLSQAIASKMRDIRGLREVASSVEEGKPELRMNLKRDAVAHYGLNTAQIAQTVRDIVQGTSATRYRVGGDSLDVVVRGQEVDRERVDQLRNLLLLTPTGARVTVGTVADLSVAQGPVAITRSGQTRQVQVTSDLVGRNLGDAVNDIKAAVGTIQLPAGYTVEYSGQYEQMTDAFGSLSTAFIMAAILVFGILAVQFESLIHPFTIMLSIPLAIIGVVTGLLVTGRTLNIAAFIGIIMLAGIVVNNAIVLIDYVNQLRRRGISRHDALVTAGVVRLRPILMTALTTILAMVPMAFALQEGTEMEAPLATVVVFGLTFSTFLTVVFVPVVYTLLEDLVAAIAGRFKPAPQSTLQEVSTDD